MDRSGMARGVHGFLLLFGLSLPLLMAPQVGQGQTDVSIQQIKARLRANPADGRAYEDLGIAYHKGRRYDEAVAAFEQALALHPEYQDIPAVSPELAEASGCETVFDALGQLKGARPESLLAFREGLVSSGGIVALAVARQARPIPRLPERAASMAMASRKTLAGIWEELAATRLAQRRRIEAMEALEKSLALDSSRLSACKSLGSCYQALGFHAAAITILNRYIALAPEPDPVVTMMVSDAQRALGLAEAAQETFERALQEFRRRTDSRPGDVPVLNEMGFSCLDRGAYADAVEAFESSLLLNPRQATVARRLGLAQYCVGARDEAVAALQRAVTLAPDDALSWMWLGRIREVSGDAAGALAAFQSAAATQPGLTKKDHPPAYLALAYSRAGNPGLAADWLEAEITAAPGERDSAFAGWILALVERQRGRMPEALAAVRRSLELEPRAQYTVDTYWQLVKEASPGVRAALEAAGRAEARGEVAKTVGSFQEALLGLPAGPEHQEIFHKLIRLAAGKDLAFPAEAQRLMARADSVVRSAKGPLDFERASLDYRAALVEAPWSPALYLDLAILSMLRGQYGEALGSIELYSVAEQGEDGVQGVVSALKEMEENGKKRLCSAPPAVPRAAEESPTDPPPQDRETSADEQEKLPAAKPRLAPVRARP